MVTCPRLPGLVSAASNAWRSGQISTLRFVVRHNTYALYARYDRRLSLDGVRRICVSRSRVTHVQAGRSTCRTDLTSGVAWQRHFIFANDVRAHCCAEGGPRPMPTTATTWWYGFVFGSPCCDRHLRDHRRYCFSNERRATSTFCRPVRTTEGGQAAVCGDRLRAIVVRLFRTDVVTMMCDFTVDRRDRSRDPAPPSSATWRRYCGDDNPVVRTGCHWKAGRGR